MATKEMHSKYTKPKLNNKISVSISASRITLTPASKAMLKNTTMDYTMMKLMMVHMIRHWTENMMIANLIT
jgi:hypothetical protein